MQKKMLKRIFGVFVLGFTLTFATTLNVYAVDETACNDLKNKITSGAWENRYGPELEEDKSNKKYYILKLGAKNVAKDIDKKKVKFKITQIEAYKESDNGGKSNYVSITGNDISKYIIGDNKVLTFAKTIKIDASTLINSNGGGTLEVKIEPDGDYDDPLLVSTCGEGTKILYFKTDITSGGDPTYKDLGGYTEPGEEVRTQEVDCSGDYETRYANDSVIRKFCKAKINALNETKNGATYVFDEKHLTFDSKYKTAVFKCNYNDYIPNGTNTGDEYYTNTKYMYGYIIREIGNETYAHNYEDGADNSDVAKCKVKCEESVTVEYGPPVASKAGLCFEYKVRVTSVVTCDQIEKPNKPREDKLCEPTPTCKARWGTYYREGGPNEDFDQCVKSCDGGKYTDKCSLKCYNEVYGSSISKTSAFEISYVDKLNSANNSNVDFNKVADDTTPRWGYDDSGNLVWMPYGKVISGKVARNAAGCTGKNNEHTCSTDPAYYRNNYWSGTGNYHYYNHWGIPAAGSCTDTCWWNGGACKGNYVNQKTADDDHKTNQEIYEKLVSECQAAVSCSSTTATFTISVDYTNGKGKKTKIDFPYSTNEDKISSLGKNNEGLNTSKNANSTILSYAGCYKDGSVNKWYQTEWSFQGTWLNNKNGDISYKPITGSGWTEISDKFCIPLDARDVNTKWWSTYYNTLYGNDSSYSYNDSEARDNFESSCSGRITNSKNKAACEYTSFTSSDAKDLDWNITASARKFGLFEWNIDIKCFYALYSEYELCATTSKGKDNQCKNTYGIRSVDLANLFPSEDTPKLSSPDKTGRTPGFNWSKYSEQTKKDVNYKSQPSEYTKWVQTKAYEVYSDRYLDYEVNLTKDVMSKIIDHGRDYTKWEGTADVDSTTNYKSPLFRKGGVLAKNSKYPNAQALKCNNMKNYKSSECEDFSKEVK